MSEPQPASRSPHTRAALPWLSRSFPHHRSLPPGGSFLPVRSFLNDLPIFALGLALLYSVVALARYWSGPFTPQVEIDLHARALPLYAFYSVLRISLAYFLSLAVTLVYGYIAAYHARAERFMVPLLDILQSIPVLSFLPGVMLAMVALFPRRQLGLELGAILLIFTGQFCNMAFSFYSSLKSIPHDLREAAQLYRFSGWQSFVQMELPYAVIGLLWNSMMSVAGGWFFLIACEMFVLGQRDFRLPGLGSYLQTAASAGDTGAMLRGLAVMLAVIILTDQLVWRPAIAWAQKFKFENVEAGDVPTSPVLSLLRRSQALAFLARWPVAPLREALALHFAKGRPAEEPDAGQASKSATDFRKWLLAVLGLAAAVGIAFGVFKSAVLLSGLSRAELRSILMGGAATSLRIGITLFLGGLWTIPAGVAIGVHPRLARVAQPVAQIAASVPATALFPMVVLALSRVGGGLSVGSIVLLLLGTQWYILFNVIAGASAIPTDLREVCAVCHFSRLERWRKLILPAIFPYLVTGLVTASGGAWNASIVAEYFHLNGKIFSTTGLGAVISQATDNGNFRVLLAATLFMAAVVVTINRLVWRRLYSLAASRFRLEM